MKYIELESSSFTQTAEDKIIGQFKIWYPTELNIEGENIGIVGHSQGGVGTINAEAGRCRK